MDKPKEMESECARCGSYFGGRVTDAFLESLGMRKIDGEWICGFCTGIGHGGLRRGAAESDWGDQA